MPHDLFRALLKSAYFETTWGKIYRVELNLSTYNPNRPEFLESDARKF